MWSIQEKRHQGVVAATTAAAVVAAGAAIGTVAGVKHHKHHKLYSKKTAICDHMEVYTGGIEHIIWVTTTDNDTLSSWVDMNPGWDVRRIHSDDAVRVYLPNLVDRLTVSDIAPQYIQEIYCINILKRYGGVWVGNKLQCEKPLSTWINTRIQAPVNILFVRKQVVLPYIDGCIFAANRYCAMISALCKEVNAYWTYKMRKQTRIKHDIIPRRVATLCMHNNVFNRRWTKQKLYQMDSN